MVLTRDVVGTLHLVVSARQREEETIARSDPGRYSSTNITDDRPTRVNSQRRRTLATPRTVLLVEDDPDLRTAMAEALRETGYNVVACPDGVDAEAAVQDDIPDLVVVEMLLPGRSGFQVVQLVKERSDGSVPVVMTSWFTSPAHQDYAHATGADAFLCKPFALPDLARAAVHLCPPARPGSGSRTVSRPSPVRS
jgi:CheY-like chemotaxis protein